MLPALALLWRLLQHPHAHAWLCLAALAAATHMLQDVRGLELESSRRHLRAALQPDGRCDFEGRIAEAWSLPLGARRARIDLRSLSCRRRRLPVRARLLLTWPSAGDARPLPQSGDELRGHAHLHLPDRSRNPGGPDRSSLLAARGILLLGNAKSPALLKVKPSSSSDPLATILNLRAALLARLHAAVARLGTPEPPTAPLLSALLLGHRAGLEQPTRSALMAGGLYHLVAISGLHVALVAWLLLKLAAPLRLAPGLKAALIAACLCLFVLLVGAPASAVRALGLLLLWSASRFSGRLASPLSLLAALTILLLWIGPGLASDTGFWLSVCATAGIMAGLGQARAREQPPALSGMLARAMHVSAAAYVAVSPLQALWFQRWTPFGILLNLAGVPWCAFLLVCAMVLSALGDSAAAIPVAALADLGVRALLWIVSAPIFEWEALRLSPPAAAVLGGHLVAAAGSFLGRGRRAEWRCLLATLHVALLLPCQPLARPSLELTLWDVGQGEAALLRLPDGGHILIDTGSRLRSGDTAMARWALPALRATGVRRVQALVLTHMDSDHAAGLQPSLAALRPREIWIPCALPSVARKRIAQLAEKHESRLRSWCRGQAEERGGAWIEALAPELNPQSPADNAGSLVLRVSWQGHSLLLTGDLEARGERRLTASGLQTAQVLKVAHHGSRNSSGEWFLRRVRPRVALISAGMRNPWGHPHRETLERLRRAGVWVLSTSRGGSVRVRLASGTLRMERWRGRWETVGRLRL